MFKIQNIQKIKKIITLIFFTSVIIFSGCENKDEAINQINTQEINNKINNNINLQDITSELQKRSAYFTLEKIEENKVLLVLNNPKNQKIQSFSSEIIFPPHLVQVSNLENLSEENFALFMKSDWKIDNKMGHIKIASSQMGTAKEVPETINLATFKFENTKNNTFIFDINENISNIFVINSKNNSQSTSELNSIVNKKLSKDLIIR
jgi:hypothetical protein